MVLAASCSGTVDPIYCLKFPNLVFFNLFLLFITLNARNGKKFHFF